MKIKILDLFWFIWLIILTLNIVAIFLYIQLIDGADIWITLREHYGNFK